MVYNGNGEIRDSGIEKRQLLLFLLLSLFDCFRNRIKSFIYLGLKLVGMSRILSIYEALCNRKKNVCSRDEILEIIHEYNKSLGKVRGKIDVQNALWYLSRHSYIRRIIFNFYYINSLDEKKRNFCRYEDKELLFMVLNKLNLRWYVGLNSALYLLGKIWQVPNILTIINAGFSGKKVVLGLKVRFVKIKESLIFGVKEGRTKNGALYSYSDLAKTYIDLSYLRESPQLVRYRNTKKYLQKYPLWLRRLT